MRVGIDAGSKYIKAVVCSETHAMAANAGCAGSLFFEHHGNPAREISRILEAHSPHDVNGVIRSIADADTVGVTGLFAEAAVAAIAGKGAAVVELVDEIAAVIDAARFHGCNCRYIVNVGGGSIKYVELDSGGMFSSYRENSLCAAGTGSFLDEQMRRMDFSYESANDIPLQTDPPDIATRCAVFAKSDLIHRQQEGFSRAEMWSGLCRGVASTMLHSVFRGSLPDAPVLFCGGLFLNHQVRYWVQRMAPNAVFRDDGHFFPAIGAALAAGEGRRDTARGVRRAVCAASGGCAAPAGCDRGGGLPDGNDYPQTKARRVLECSKSRTAPYAALCDYMERDNEVRIHRAPSTWRDTALGIDIGSTSTKCVLVDAASHEVLCDIYRKTGGDPMFATGEIFQALRDAAAGDIRVVACATTGSGRRLVGKIIGADLIINEITAHFHGARQVDPSIETVFEIGGQDSKYIRGANGAVVDCAMNFVCAAGTGSFIEEQAARLGYDIRDVGGIAAGKIIPRASDRCTVFMEQDITMLLREGASREEALAAVHYAIAKNYLTRVVGARPVTGDRIFFQGATARNRALVAAFELLTGREIVVSPHCHIMGAYGAALLAIDRQKRRASGFRGVDVFTNRPRLEYRQCGDCANKCTLTVAVFDGGAEETWGFMCGREGVDAPRGKKSVNHFAAVESMMRRSMEDDAGASVKSPAIGKKIGIPAALSMFNYLPLWETFLSRLGFEVVVSAKSDRADKSRAIEISRADFCFPVKMGLAHAHSLAMSEKVDAVFYPAIISEKKQPNGLPRIFCPYVISYPSLAGAALALPAPVLRPPVDFRLDDEIMVNELAQSFAGFGLARRDIASALRDGRRRFTHFMRRRYEYGRGILEKIRREGTAGIVFIGRPYNLYDRVINLGLPEHFRRYGVETFPYECLIDPDDTRSDVFHMYWNYGERILSLAETIRGLDGVYPVYFTNFGCGPDSFILSRFEKTMEGKPYLIIELDEHASDTGYLTRIEAFMDVVLGGKAAADAPRYAKDNFSKRWSKSAQTLWIPPMHEYSGRLTAAGFRAWGFHAEALSVEDADAFELGRRGVRGSECLPASSTIGIFLKTMKQIGARPAEHALFMPTAEGPCRFGQYAVLHRSILDANGYHETEIFSPSSVNSYMGMPESLRMYLWDILIAGDLLMKCACKTRPYEIHRGDTDAALEAELSRLERIAEKKGDLMNETVRSLSRIAAVPMHEGKKPLVGVVGEIYVRCSPFCNNGLIRRVEDFGGEAWLSPISEWILYTSWMERYFAHRHRWGFFRRTIAGIKTGYLFRRYARFEKAVAPLMAGYVEPAMEHVLEIGARYLPLDFEGEAIITLGRAAAFIEGGAALVVNCAPFGCMPGNVTAAMFHRIQEAYGVPVLTLFYDGESDINRMVGVYLRNLGVSSPADGAVVR